MRGKAEPDEVDENMHETLLQLVEEPGFAVLEVKTDRSENLAMHRQYWRGAVDIVSAREKE